MLCNLFSYSTVLSLLLGPQFPRETAGHSFSSFKSSRLSQSRGLQVERMNLCLYLFFLIEPLEQFMLTCAFHFLTELLLSESIHPVG